MRCSCVELSATAQEEKIQLLSTGNNSLILHFWYESPIVLFFTDQGQCSCYSEDTGVIKSTGDWLFLLKVNGRNLKVLSEASDP